MIDIPKGHLETIYTKTKWMDKNATKKEEALNGEQMNEDTSNATMKENQ